MESKNELFSLLFTFPTWRRFLTRQISTYWSQHDPERTITTSKYGRSVLWLASRPGQRILKRRPPLPTPPPVPNAPAIVSANADRHRALIHGQYRTEQHTGVAADGAVWERGRSHGTGADSAHTRPQRTVGVRQISAEPDQIPRRGDGASRERGRPSRANSNSLRTFPENRTRRKGMTLTGCLRSPIPTLGQT